MEQNKLFIRVIKIQKYCIERTAEYHVAIVYLTVTMAAIEYKTRECTASCFSYFDCYLLELWKLLKVKKSFFSKPFFSSVLTSTRLI